MGDKCREERIDELFRYDLCLHHLLLSVLSDLRYKHGEIYVFSICSYVLLHEEKGYGNLTSTVHASRVRGFKSKY